MLTTLRSSPRELRKESWVSTEPSRYARQCYRLLRRHRCVFLVLVLPLALYIAVLCYYAIPSVEPVAGRGAPVLVQSNLGAVKTSSVPTRDVVASSTSFHDEINEDENDDDANDDEEVAQQLEMVDVDEVMDATRDPMQSEGDAEAEAEEEEEEAEGEEEEEEEEGAEAEAEGDDDDDDDGGDGVGETLDLTEEVLSASDFGATEDHERMEEAIRDRLTEEAERRVEETELPAERPPLTASQLVTHKEETTENENEEKDEISIAISDEEVARRREAVQDALLHAWTGYKTYAWGADELKPQSNKGSDWLHMGLTVIDTLDTLWIMGLENEFLEGVAWVEQELDFAQPVSVSFFETVIRSLGGLLAAYELSNFKHPVLLEKAHDLAHRLSWAFNTTMGVPYGSINLVSHTGQNPTWTQRSSILSEIGSIQLEFTFLSFLTQDHFFAKRANAVYDLLDRLPKRYPGLCPIYVNPSTGQFTSNHITFGALGDSYYEYLLKLWVLTGKETEQYLRMFKEAMQGMAETLIQRSTPSGLAYVADMKGSSLVHKMDHLACFTPGMLALGAQEIRGATYDTYMTLAEDLAYTCYQMYAREPSGIAPEFAVFEAGRDFKEGAKHYILRPETLESLFILWRTTKKPQYRQWGWQIFQAIEKHCKTPSGYAGLVDVRTAHPSQDDKMQSFFLSETLKYLYLLFCPDDVIPLDTYVFNTEAHPLRRLDKWDEERTALMERSVTR